MRHLALLLASLLVMIGTGFAQASPGCPADAPMGTSRTITIDARGGGALGTLQYEQTLELEPGEIVFTFDDGPNPETTPRILDTLDTYCIKATFFLIGIYAERHPDLVAEIVRRGHTLANHTWSHALLHQVSRAAAYREIERGETAILEVLTQTGSPSNALLPMMRFPGLNDTDHLIDWLNARDRITLSCDIGTDDWRRISPQTLYHRALRNIEARGSGIVIFHDIQERTAQALPGLLETLSERGFRAVALAAPSIAPPPALSEETHP